MRMNPPNARFWVWECDGWVKLTLKPGQTLRYCYGGPHEEGYSYSEQEFEYDADEMVVISRYTNNSRDCDGPLDYRSESHCRIDELQAEPPDTDDPYGPRPARPNWQKGESCQRDHYAEAMGY